MHTYGSCPSLSLSSCFLSPLQSHFLPPARWPLLTSTVGSFQKATWHRGQENKFCSRYPGCKSWLCHFPSVLQFPHHLESKNNSTYHARIAIIISQICYFNSLTEMEFIALKSICLKCQLKVLSMFRVLQV